VREAAVGAVVAMAPAAGNDIHGMLARHTIRPGQLKEITARLGGMDLVNSARHTGVRAKAWCLRIHPEAALSKQCQLCHPPHCNPLFPGII